MKTLLVVICVLALTQAFQFRPTDAFPVSKPNNLRFGNYTGQGVSSEMRSQIVNIINGASGFYKDDVAANIKYIKSNLDDLYGSGTANFFVYIQTDANIRFSWYVWLTSEYVIAGLEDVNVINPGWSYLIVKMFAPTELDAYTYLKNPVIGPGITDAINTVITNTINDWEPAEDVCSCNDQSIVNIGNTLINYYGRAWNTVCDANGVTEALVFTVEGLWGTFKAKNCYYTLFVNQ